MDISHDIILYIALAVFLGFPFWRILRRTDLSSYFVALVLVAWLGYLVLEAVLAFARWPRAEPTPAKREGIS